MCWSWQFLNGVKVCAFWIEAHYPINILMKNWSNFFLSQKHKLAMKEADFCYSKGKNIQCYLQMIEVGGVSIDSIIVLDVCYIIHLYERKLLEDLSRNTNTALIHLSCFQRLQYRLQVNEWRTSRNVCNFDREIDVIIFPTPKIYSFYDFWTKNHGKQPSLVLLCS